MNVEWKSFIVGGIVGTFVGVPAYRWIRAQFDRVNRQAGGE